ncbi:hypothetical protein [Mucilaginibacter sp.]|uniref:hypothetical protein n=1 Tax=Mucilaginibacter sp. TaxID=1882438 RepID=UPI0028424D54|nr:hypothetical protein [Mucilaginibacter sp.]MDR3696363.1 hypothetical protein [Mucilaginibacter sp.]
MSYDDSGKDYKCCPHCDTVAEENYFTFKPIRGDGRCDFCHGEGEVDDSLIAEASRMIESVITLGFGHSDISDTKPCPKCSGTGQCQSCGGNGRVKNDEYEDDEYENHSDEDEGSTEEYDSYQADYSDDDYSYHTSSYDSEDSNSSSTASNFTPTPASSNAGVIVIILLIIAVGIAVFISSSKKPNNPIVSQTINTTSSQTGQSQPQVSPLNPYGDGNGEISFYRDCEYCRIEVYNDTTLLGKIPTPGLLMHPSCGDSYMFPVIIQAGNRTFIFKNDEGQTWQLNVDVIEGQCEVVKVLEPSESQTSGEVATQSDSSSSSPATQTQQPSPNNVNYPLIEPGESFLKANVIYKFTWEPNTTYVFSTNQQDSHAMLSFVLPDNLENIIFKEQAWGPGKMLINFGNENPNPGGYLIYSDEDVQVLISSVNK